MGRYNTELVYGWIVRLMDKWMAGCIVGYNDKWTDGWNWLIDGWINVLMYRWI